MALPYLSLPKVDWNWGRNDHGLGSDGLCDVRCHPGGESRDRERLCSRFDERFNANTDLVGLALANIGFGLSGTFVVNGSPTKTQIVDSAGGRSQLSLLVMSAIVLLILLSFTGEPLAYMPEAALSAIVFFLIGVGLIDIAGMRRVFEQRRSEFWVALITAA